MNDPLRLRRHLFGTLVFLLAPAAVWVGCSTATVSEPASVYHTMNQRFALSLRERAHLRAKAWDGDGEAAYRLHEYFVYIKRDRALGRYWCRVAAKHDNASGLLGMVFYLHEDPSLGKPGEIDYWFKRAYAVVHEEHALEYLRDMELSVKEQSADP